MREHRETPEAACILALLMTPGSGIVTVNRIISALHQAGTPLRAVIGQSRTVLQRGLSVGLDWAIDPLTRVEAATIDRARFLHDHIHESSGQWIYFGQSDYPARLRDTLEYNAPPLFTIHGDTALLTRPSVSIVGARDPSEHGATLAKELARWCHDCDRVVISGGAQGVDSAAHHEAFDCGGSTVFVVPEGALEFRGPEWLQEAVDSGRAAVLSQNIPDAPWSTSAALTRNQTIASLSPLVAVIDPGETGGSIRTGRHALDLGQRTLVYAYDKINSGYASLMREGAFPVLNESGQWDADYLEQQWARGGQSQGKQVDLF